MSSNLNEENVGGYSVAYSRDDTYFPIYVMALVTAVFVGAAWFTGGWYWLVLAAATAAFTYYNLPLLETGRPTIGANQYGIFIQAFGLIRWRAIKEINLVPIAPRPVMPRLDVINRIVNNLVNQADVEAVINGGAGIPTE